MSNPTTEEQVAERDQYGNTPDQQINCSFPDCGCNGARLCMTGEPNDAACTWNVEKRA